MKSLKKYHRQRLPLFTLLLLVTISLCGSTIMASDLSVTEFPLLVQLTSASDGTGELEECEAELDTFTSRQYRAISVHKAFAFTTAGLLLAADGMGLYHFLQLQNRGHEIRDEIGFSESSSDKTPQTNGVQEVWRDDRSQTERAIHTGLIALGSLSYATTATIELTMPRTSKSTSRITSTKLHRSIFFIHAVLMAANIGLGIVESNALSKGNHDVVQGTGIAHLVVGFSIPVLMIGAGTLFKLPIEY